MYKTFIFSLEILFFDNDTEWVNDTEFCPFLIVLIYENRLVKQYVLSKNSLFKKKNLGFVIMTKTRSRNSLQKKILEIKKLKLSGKKITFLCV